MNLTIQHDPGSAFRTVIDGEECFLLYGEASGGVLDYRSTFVPPSLRNRGVATALVRHALEYAMQENYRVRPTCWFVARTMSSDPRYRALRVPPEVT